MPPPSTFGGHWVERAMVTCNRRGNSKYLYKTPWSEGGYDDFDCWRVHSDYYPDFNVAYVAFIQVRIAGRLVACVQTAQCVQISRNFRDFIGDMAYDHGSGTGHFQLDIWQSRSRFASLLLRCGPFNTNEHYNSVSTDSIWSFLQDLDGGYAHIMMISLRDGPP